MRASKWRPSIRWIVTGRRSRRAKLRKTSWMLGCADATTIGVQWPGPSGTVSSRIATPRAASAATHALACRRRSPGPSNQIRVRLFAKPDQLPSRVATVLLHDERARLRLVAHAARASPSPGDRRVRRTDARPAARRARAGRAPRRRCRARTARPRAAPRARPSARAAACSATLTTSQSAISERVSPKCVVSGRPVVKYTSSARTSRFRSRGMMRAADSGSTRCSIRCSRSGPRRAGDPVEPRPQRLVRAWTRETGRASARGSRSRCRRRESAAGRGAWMSRIAPPASRANCAAV